MLRAAKTFVDIVSVRCIAVLSFYIVISSDNVFPRNIFILRCCVMLILLIYKSLFFMNIISKVPASCASDILHLDINLCILKFFS